MALDPINDLVKCRLPFATDIDDKIESFKIEAFYFFQSYFGIDDADVEDENAYTSLQRMLIADYVAWQLLVRKAVEISGGTTGSGTGSGAKRIKRAKADVVESEFDYAKSSDGSQIMLNTEDLIANLKAAMCQKAYTLGIRLPFCDDLCYDVVPPFKLYC